MKAFYLSSLILLTSCSLFSPPPKSPSAYGLKKDAKVSEADREDVLEIIERDYKDSLKGCFDLESFANSYRVILLIDVRTKGKISNIRIKEKDSFKMTKTLRQCLGHHRKMIELPKDTKSQTVEIEIAG